MSSLNRLADNSTVETLTTLIREIGKRCPGGRLPDSYLVLDLETSGFAYKNPHSSDGRFDVVVQIGYAVVKDRQLVDCAAHLIKRPRGTMKGEALEVTGITDDMLQERGLEPANIIPKVLELIDLYKSVNGMFVGHNIMTFDAPFMHHDFKRAGFDVEITKEECLDTGAIIKAARLGLTPSMMETLAEFQHRIRYIRSRVKWNLEISTELLNLNELHGVDMAHAHDAGYDCRVTHLVLEELRNRTWL
jgi:DNA polymerase III epsilon subunit-like protein